VDPPQQQDLDQCADCADDESGRDDPTPESQRAADTSRKRICDVSPQHIKGTMGDIDDAGNAENQRQSDGDKKQTRGGGKPVERLKQKPAEGHETNNLSPRRGERLANIARGNLSSFRPDAIS